jgi:simple sugar transport system substrate-binding protein
MRRAAAFLVALAACADAPPSPAGEERRIIVVTHGQSSDPFWSVVSNGAHDAGEELGVRVEYQAPPSFDMWRMAMLIDAAVASRPDGLVVSVPDADALRGAIRAATDRGIPVVSINSGDAAWQDLGVLAHIGQTEYEAGYGGGERLAAAGARRVLCINHEVGNAALDLRCDGLRDALTAAGGVVRVLAVDLADPEDARQRIGRALAADSAIDGILALGPNGATPALTALRESGAVGRVAFATFDLGPEVLAAVRDGEALFAIDQQPYLQGWLGIALLVKYLDTGAVAGGGQIVRTGPGFVTQADAARVIEATERGVR